VRWQIQRLRRIRCDIVYSVRRGANHLLLCSNLTHNLKDDPAWPVAGIAVAAELEWST